MDHKKEFIKLFNQIARYHSRYEVFRDMVTIQAYSLHNAIAYYQPFEDEYFRIIKRYDKQDVKKMADLLGHVVEALEAGFCDFLGSVYMELEISNKQCAQFFTPYHLSLSIAKMTAPTEVDDKVTVQEPACGAGGMVIAFAEALKDNKINYQRKLWVQAIDVDEMVACMAYIQMSLLHIPGEVVVGNALSGEVRKVLKTPAHYFGCWDAKLAESEVVESDSSEEIQPEVKPLKEGEQLALI